MIPLAIILTLHIRLVVVRTATDAVALLLLVLEDRHVVGGNREGADLVVGLASGRIYLLWFGRRVLRVNGRNELCGRVL